MRTLTGLHARQAIERSLRPSVRAITSTLGPQSCVVLYDRGGRPAVAQDGFEVAREAADASGTASIGPRILKEVLAEARRELGDGTARLACILGATFAEGTRLVAAGADPGALADEMLALQDRLETILRAGSCDAAPPLAVALAAGADEETATAVAAALGHAGADGSIEVRPGIRPGIVVETGEGFLLDVEPVSAWLGPGAGERLELANVHVLVVDDMVSELGRLAPVLEGFVTRGKSLAIVARGIGGAALDTLVVNHRENRLHVAALRPAEVAGQAATALEDLAVATGATLVAERLGTSLGSLRPAMLGRAARIVIAGGRALFAEPAGDPEAVALQRRLLDAEGERQRYLSLNRERLERRAGRLSGRWADLRVTGLIEAETERRVTATRSALSAVRAAASGGVVAGAGAALCELAAALRLEAAVLPMAAPRGARLCIAAGCAAVAGRIAHSGDGGPECIAAVTPMVPDPLATTAGLLCRAISAAGTMLRIETIICE